MELKLGEWKEFKKCPQCGSDQRFGEQLTNEIKDKGWAREEFEFCLQIYQSVVVDQTQQAKIPIGSKVPGLTVHTDVCMECGTIYATKIMRIEATKSITPAQIQPNRMQRRHPGGPPLFNGN